jgi:predicted transcriptional regulator of viral defense system
MTTDLSAVPDRYLAEGRYSATLRVLCRELDVADYSIRQAYQRWEAKGWAFSPSRGLYVFVPSSHRSRGVIPPLWYIDSMMRHLHRGHYVGLLSAAEQHGASHQAAQVFQVFVDRELKDRVVKGQRLEFHTHRAVNETPINRLTVPSGTVKVSTREATAGDLVVFVGSSGGWQTVATAIGELAEDGLDPNSLAMAAQRHSLSNQRRLGWILDQAFEGLTHVLKVQVGDVSNVIPLETSSGDTGVIDRRWGVRLNRRVEADW